MISSYGSINPDFEITEYIHVVDKCLIWGFIRIEVGVYLSVGEKFC